MRNPKVERTKAQPNFSMIQPSVESATLARDPVSITPQSTNARASVAAIEKTTGSTRSARPGLTTASPLDGGRQVIYHLIPRGANPMSVCAPGEGAIRNAGEVPVFRAVRVFTPSGRMSGRGGGSSSATAGCRL